MKRRLLLSAARIALLLADYLPPALYKSGGEIIRDNPCRYRHWTGYLDVEGAKLSSIRDYFDHRYSEFARTDL